ncbi:MAG: lysophospholipase [Promethearchaeota archaeon]
MENLSINPILKKLREPPVADDFESDYFESFDCKKIFYRTWKPLGEVQKIVLIAHGMAGHGEFFVLLADKLIHEGIMVISPDFRHHGHSDGKKGDLPSFKKILKDYHLFMEFIRKKHPKIPIFLLGESMGGAVSINFAKYFPDDFQKLSGIVLFAPAIKLNFPKSFWLGIGILTPLITLVRIFIPSKGIISMKGNEKEGIKNPLHQQYDREDPYHLEKVSMRYLIQLFKHVIKCKKIAPKITIPTLIFQGTDDKVISIKGAKRFYNHLESKDKTLIIVEEGFHSLFTDSAFQDKWKILVEWFKQH